MEFITLIQSACPSIIALAYTISEDRDTVFAAMQGGAPVSPGIARRLLEELLHAVGRSQALQRARHPGYLPPPLS